MITVALTYRDRNLALVERCLDTLQLQSNRNFDVVLVDYGSSSLYKKELGDLSVKYEFVTVIRCETEGQLWCKSRALNIALKGCSSDYFFVGDVDMIFRSDFIDKLNNLKDQNTITYFQVGFLDESESKRKVEFTEYSINFKSNAEATGMSLFPINALLEINGYDEFYHGWGGEDTDAHLRLKNGGYTVNFYNDTILMLHQWHPKGYRTLSGNSPFHTRLEKINHNYLKLSKAHKRVKANTTFAWGVPPQPLSNDLGKADTSFLLSNVEDEIRAFVANVLLVEKNKLIHVKVKPHKMYNSFKERSKKLIGKKTLSFMSMEQVNNLLLETIVFSLRDRAYRFSFDNESHTISLTIKL